jgi:cyclic pyranopterin phosphate synthase
MVDIYADGACLGNPGPGGWGVVVVRDGRPEVELSGHEPATTNNRMEIRAVIEGLKRVSKDEPVRVLSDSSYVINTQSAGWKRNKNHDLWAELDGVAAGRTIEWEWVRGHAGDTFNEMANQLAQSAAASPTLTHLDRSGKARMVDVGEKAVTDRIAVARAEMVMQPETLAQIRSNGFEKGDVLGVARVAGVMAAKRTHELIPLCHTIPLTQVTVDFDDASRPGRVTITATARAAWKTGVEMEALTAATVAALTIYDMCKAVDRGMRIESVRVVRKAGGRSGDWDSE